MATELIPMGRDLVEESYKSSHPKTNLETQSDTSEKSSPYGFKSFHARVEVTLIPSHVFFCGHCCSLPAENYRESFGLRNQAVKAAKFSNFPKIEVPAPCENSPQISPPRPQKKNFSKSFLRKIKLRPTRKWYIASKDLTLNKLLAHRVRIVRRIWSGAKIRRFDVFRLC